MKRAATAILAATAVVAVSSQAQAQDGYVLPPPPPPVAGYAQPDYAQLPQMPPQVQMPAPAYAAQGYQEYAAPGYAAPAYAAPYPVEAPPAAHYGAGLPPVASVGYTRADRDQWLRDCRAAYEGSAKKTGSILGYVAGAVGGAVIGRHETSGSAHRRLGGTLLGAGVGGLVGLLLGSVIGGAFDKKKKDQCEAYLDRYQGGGALPGPEAGFGQGWQRNINWGQYGYGNYGGYGYGYGGYTTVMVPIQIGAGYTYGAPIRTENRYVIEDVVEQVVTVPHRTKYVKRAPTKYVPTKYVKDKRVRYAK